MSSTPLDINTYEPSTPAIDKDAGSDSGRERRAHERFAIDLAGGLSRDGKDFAACRVRDFCLDGVMVVLDGSTGDEHVVGGAPVESGESLVLRFSVTIEGGEREHQAQVRVARISNGSLGLSFDGENAEAVWQLRQLASQLEEERRKSREQDRNANAPSAPMPLEQAVNAGEMLEAAKNLAEQFLMNGMAGLFKEAEDRLIAGTQQATTDSGKTDALDALKEVKEIRVPVETAYLDAVGRQYDTMVNPNAVVQAEAPETAQELALVDTGSFDDWVTTKNMISAAESVQLRVAR